MLASLQRRGERFGQRGDKEIPENGDHKLKNIPQDSNADALVQNWSLLIFLQHEPGSLCLFRPRDCPAQCRLDFCAVSSFRSEDHFVHWIDPVDDLVLLPDAMRMEPWHHGVSPAFPCRPFFPVWKAFSWNMPWETRK